MAALLPVRNIRMLKVQTLEGVKMSEKEKIQKIENQEWIDSIDYIIKNEDEKRVEEIIELIKNRALGKGIHLKLHLKTPYVNTIPVSEESKYPGNRELERKIKSIIRWNAMAMVVQANRKKDGIGGHISTYASAATLYEVGFNHFFRGGEGEGPADIVYFQGHASPGIYARSFLEGRISEKLLENFRRELQDSEGLTSYPHPRLMQDYWQFPTVSMGLGPIMAIYQARFCKYLQDKGLLEAPNQKIWVFTGDGEMDEPESMGALTLASREELDNLIFVVNCNLQRLDGPVRGNSSIIQELEGAFRGAGWNVIKVILGESWDPLLAKDKDGILKKRLGELVDGERQKYSISDGDYIRKNFFGKFDELRKMVKDMSDDDLAKLRRGGHDPLKVFNAFKKAVESEGVPTVILAQTIKGYGLGEAGEGRNITHQQKKMNEEELIHFRDRFNIPISDEKVAEAPFYHPGEESEEIKYLREQRTKLGGFLPKRNRQNANFKMPDTKVFDEFLKGSGKREVATTMAAVQLLGKLLKDKEIGQLIVPIVPDESRTFGMDALFRQVGIYAHTGQLYEPVDRESLLYYKEAKDGAILEEGITEAGSMSSFIAAGTAYSTHQINCVPFYIFYSMFGFQRVGDLIWAAADARTKGFLLGGTAGRTTLAGEGLQHQDGHSHLLALSVPSVRAYDPAFAYEMAVIIRDGMKRMYMEGEDVFYYITVMNEKYKMPSIPARKGIETGIINGMYKYRSSQKNKYNLHLLGSGSILNEALKASEILKKDYNIFPEVWSVTSYKKLYDNAIETERSNRVKDEKALTYIEECVGTKKGTFIAASDYVKALPLTVSKWFPGTFMALGTDGFGLSEHRDELREYFEINASHIVWCVLTSLHKQKKVDIQVVEEAKQKLNIISDKTSPTSI
jgi:pyruvate dehydrogenase E1 component